MDRFDKVFFPLAAGVLLFAGSLSMPDLVSGGLAPAIIAALIGAGGGLLGSLFQGIGDSQAANAEQEAGRRQAAKLEDIARLLTNFDSSGLEAQASSVLSQGQGALNAQLAQRGIYNSGAGMAMHQGLAGDVMGNLAQQINQDELQRLLAVMQMYQSGEGTPTNVPGSAYGFAGLGSAFSGIGQGAFGAIPYADGLFPQQPKQPPGLPDIWGY